MNDGEGSYAAPFALGLTEIVNDAGNSVEGALCRQSTTRAYTGALHAFGRRMMGLGPKPIVNGAVARSRDLEGSEDWFVPF